ncbi:MAG: hypothetical protein EF806_02695 [Candidatus Methanoliparum thermophilum]|uniref:UPF0282 protein EF806_02695 n=1 Tax=Methanoliparum thermophilum TaxID=2491083 RepID=A0A520KSS2_METT2|nr:hypothetical protein [Candidatus Methanoliparum sp. LAM-1]RZN64969.1 MAG: hypothetical protein EF806_02695 [Candidatus Methanoliparum thermophilum]BDC36148.1 hypothetical protein MTLP_08300 [Candidatus Methanoliparum sp. LAM-1]
MVFTIDILASESMGARSMSTFLKSTNLSMIIDPGVELAPKRFNLPPHQIEINKKEELWLKIEKYLKKSDLVAITHYHYDHYNPLATDLLKEKTLFMKDYNIYINKNQKNRADILLKNISRINKSEKPSIIIADGKELDLEDIHICFSSPVFHGVNARLGYVIQVFVSDGEKGFLFTSDVEGPSTDEQVKFVIEKSPDILFVDGPMTYLLGRSYSYLALERSIENLENIMSDTNVKEIIIDHHFMRDLKYRDKIERLYDYSEDLGVKILSAAEFMREENNLLEARRKELYARDRYA